MRISKEIKIGIAGILAIVFLYCGINFLKGINIFKTSNTYYVQFDNVCALTNSSPVFADGYNIGIVRDIEYDYLHPGHVAVCIEIDREMRLPEGTTASLETEMLGTVKMNLLLPKQFDRRCAPGDTIVGKVNGGLMATAAEMVPKLEVMLPKMDSILTAINRIVNDPALSNILHSTDEITASLSSTTKKLDNMMSKEIPEITRNLNSALANTEKLTADMDAKLNQLDVEATVAKVNKTLANVEMMTAKLNQKDNTMGLLLNDDGLYNNLNSTMENASLLLENFREHPKRYVHFSLFGKKDK